MSAPESLPNEFVFEARVSCDPLVVIGPSKAGQRQLIPITGGDFEGPAIKGKVLPGGADWQLVRPDGVTEVVARYTIQTHDSVNISVVNRGVALLPPVFQDIYMRTTPTFEAPNDSGYAWLNRSLFLATVHAISRQPLIVSVRVFRVL